MTEDPRMFVLTKSMSSSSASRLPKPENAQPYFALASTNNQNNLQQIKEEFQNVIYESAASNEPTAKLSEKVMPFSNPPPSPFSVRSQRSLEVQQSQQPNSKRFVEVRKNMFLPSMDGLCSPRTPYKDKLSYKPTDSQPMSAYTPKLRPNYENTQHL